MKKNNFIFNIILSIFVICVCFFDIKLTYAQSTNDICEFSSEYKEWLKLSEEERKLVTMPPMCKVEDKENIINNILSYSLQKSTYLPKKYDSRNVTLSDGTNKSYVTSVKNQGNTGSCWAFSTNATLESYMLKTSGVTYDLSEGHMEYKLANNSYIDNTTYEKIFNRELNEGGNYFMSSAYLMSNMGSVSEDKVPFTDPINQVTYSSINNENIKQIVDVNGISFMMTTPNSGKYSCSGISSDIKQMIIEYGSVSANVYMSNLYLNPNTSALYYNGKNTTNHAVSIVGWDDDYSKTNFNSDIMPSANGAWIVKNSWGENFETMDEGYFYVSYEDTQVCSLVTTITDADTDVVDNLYQNEKQGLNSGAGYDYAANVYTREDTNYSEMLTEVSVGAYQATDTTLYLIDNYSTTTDLNIENAKKLGTISIPYSGYETLKLETPVEVSGEKFAIIANYTNYTGSYPVGISINASGLYSTVPTNLGVSYVSEDSHVWADTASNATPYLVVLKAGTDNLDYNFEVSNEMTNEKINNIDGGSYKYDITTNNIEINDEININIYNSSNENVTDKFVINDSKISKIPVQTKDGITSLNIKVQDELPVDTYTLEINYGYITKTSNFKIYSKKIIKIDNKETSLEKIYDVNIGETITYDLSFENISDGTKLTATAKSNDNLNSDISIQVSEIKNSKATLTLTLNSVYAGDYTLSINAHDEENGIITVDDVFTIEKYTFINNLKFNQSISYIEVGKALNLYEILTNDGTNELKFEITSGSEYVSLEKGVLTSKKKGSTTIKVTPKYQTPTISTTAILTINSVLANVKIVESEENKDLYDTIGGVLTYTIYTEDVTDIYVDAYRYDTGGNFIYSSGLTQSASHDIVKVSDNEYIVTVELDETNSSGSYKLEVIGKFIKNNSVISLHKNYSHIEILKEVPAEKVEITNTENYLHVGESLDINAIVSPENTTIKTLTYTSSNDEVASFEGNKLIVKSSGEITITATARSGVYDTKTIKIINPIMKLKDVYYEVNDNVYTNEILYDKVGGIVNIPYEVNDVDTQIEVYELKNGIYEKTNLEVNNNHVSKEYEIKFLKDTKASNYRFMLSGTYMDEEGLVTLESVFVDFEVKELIEIYSMEFSKEKYTVGIKNSEYVSIMPIFNNNESIPTYPELEWTFSNEEIATREDGQIKLLQTGQTVVTVKSINGITASFILNVLEEVTNIDIFEGSDYINNYDTYITNVLPKTTKEEFINNLNLDGVTYVVENINESTGYVTTGTTLTVTQNDEVTVYTVIIFGDVNKDGQILSTDYMMIKNNVLSKYNSDIINPINEKNMMLAADINIDGQILSTDYMMIKNSVLSKYNSDIINPITQNKKIDGGN